MYAAPHVIKEISTDEDVLGLTSVDDELFALLKQDVDQVAVYSINDYQLLRHLSVPGLEPDSDNDMTSCVRYKCLYMSDNNNRYIHRYDLSSSDMIKWRVRGSPVGLSVTPICNLLVTCCGDTNKLVELSAYNGQCVREITLQSDIRYPSHSVQVTTNSELTSSQYVVCHGLTDSAGENLDRVCLVGDDGKVTRSYGGQRGSDVGHLNHPRHLAVDKDSQFFVADDVNSRVVVLSSTLEFVRCVKEKFPCRLYLHQATRRLFVSQAGGYVTVIQL